MEAVEHENEKFVAVVLAPTRKLRCKPANNPLERARRDGRGIAHPYVMAEVHEGFREFPASAQWVVNVDLASPSLAEHVSGE
jgi:hypothetical protein